MGLLMHPPIQWLRLVPALASVSQLQLACESRTLYSAAQEGRDMPQSLALLPLVCQLTLCCLVHSLLVSCSCSGPRRVGSAVGTTRMPLVLWLQGRMCRTGCTIITPAALTAEVPQQ